MTKGEITAMKRALASIRAIAVSVRGVADSSVYLQAGYISARLRDIITHVDSAAPPKRRKEKPVTGRRG